MTRQQITYTKILVEYEGKDESLVAQADKKIVKSHNKGKYYGKCNHMA